MLRSARRAGLLALAAAALLACAKPPDTGRAHGAGGAHGAILLRGNGTGPDSLDPQKARVNEAHTILRDLYECLTSLDKSAAAAPGVATRWDTSADGRTYTFHLRPEARWSNGDRVVAADFLAALRRLVDPATASQYAQVIDVVVNAHAIIEGKQPVASLGVSAPDDATVVIQLAGPAPYLPGLLSHPSTCPIHRATLARYGAAFARPGVMVVESRVPEATVKELRARGHQVEVGPDWSEGRLTAASKLGRRRRAAANPRGMQGYAAGR